MNDIKSVLVTSIGGVGKQIIDAISLSEFKYNIIGIDIRKACSVNMQISKFYQAADVLSPSYLGTIDQIIDENSVGIVFVGSLAETYWFAEHKSYFEKRDVKVIVCDIGILNLCMNKNLLFNYLMKNEINLLRFKSIAQENDIADIDYYPIVLKPNLSSNGSNFARILFNHEEALSYARYCLTRNIELIAQEWIDNLTEEYSANITMNEEMEVVGSIAINRDFSTALSTKEAFVYCGKRYVISSGISQGKIVKDQNFVEEVTRIARALNFIGSVNLQGVYHDQKFYLIDLHPAITGSVYAKALAGYNEPLYYLKKYINSNEQTKFDVKEVEIIKTINTEVFKLQ